MAIIVALIFTILSAFCYRIGGMSKESAKQYFPWFPQALVASWFRDANCVLLVLIWSLLFLPHVAWFWYLLGCGAMYGAMTTYWDDKIPPKGIDKFWMHGLMIGLAWLFIAIPAGAWLGGLIRAAVMSAFMYIWCEWVSGWIAKLTGWGTDFIDEYGRGGIIALTLLFLI